MLITSDVFDIADRLKEIDPNYTLHYNRKTKKYELRGKDGVLTLVFPYESIDARMITHARKTRIERSKALIEEMERKNRILEERREREAVEDAKDILKEVARRHYAKS